MSSFPIPVLTGDDLTSHILPHYKALKTKKPLHISPTITHRDDGDNEGGTGHKFTANNTGILSHHAPSTYVLTPVARTTITPYPLTNIIAVVKSQSSSHYTLESSTIPPYYSLQLPNLSFPGATKRNRPNIPIGSPVLCQVKKVSTNVVELTCDIIGRDFLTDGSLYGELKNGVSAPPTPLIICLMNGPRNGTPVIQLFYMRLRTLKGE